MLEQYEKNRGNGEDDDQTSADDYLCIVTPSEPRRMDGDEIASFSRSAFGGLDTRMNHQFTRRLQI